MCDSKDVIGAALLDFQKGINEQNIDVFCDVTDRDIIPISYLYRGEQQLTELECMALNYCKGKVLDVGAGSGVHSVILQQKGFETKAIDTSAGAVKVMHDRGLLNAEHVDFFRLKHQRYDTLLLLMNGLGIVGKMDRFTAFFEQCDRLLNKGGQVIADSSDISYLFMEEDGSLKIDLNAAYYGEVKYKMTYKDYSTDWFDWLFIDYHNLSAIAEMHGFTCELLFQNAEDQYLVKMIKG